MEEDLYLFCAVNYNFAGYRTLFKKLLDPDYDLDEKEKKKLKDVKSKFCKDEIKQLKEYLIQEKIQFVSIIDPNYPKRLKNITDPPIGLFCKGNIKLLSCKKSVGIVGTRAATNYGLVMGKKISKLLCREGMVIVSGLASGIDSSAHIGTLKEGRTIAVLGTAINEIYPPNNHKLAKEIIENKGLIISEYSPHTEPQLFLFPQRNRIISGLSDAILVIEGNTQSGALITARFGIKYGKPIFALPGPIDSPKSNGPNALIKSGVAKLFTSVTDILEALNIDEESKKEFNDEKCFLTNKEDKLVYDLISSSPVAIDDLIDKTGLELAEVLKTLSYLEIKQLIQKMPDGNFVKT